MRLKGKTAVITGGMKGIGLATARLFLAEGANVMLADLDEAGLNEAVAGLKHPQVDALAGDVRSADANEALARKTLARFGGIDIFFANAGVGGEPKLLLELAETDWDNLMNVNLKGVWLGMKAVVPHIIEKGGGSVIITSSMAGLVGSPKAGVYSASKHGVIGLAKSAAAEWARFNINVNTINPGPIETDMVRDLEKSISRRDPQKGKMYLESRIPFRRYGTPDEVAHLALFLSLEESRYITGATHKIDGGMSAL
jgi:NAD(P)-dependent dehydrogenase (short-subunit alcohol dehydrogenase family)